MRPKVVAALLKYDADDQIFLRFQCYWKRASKIGYKCSGMERELFKLSTKYGELGTTNSRKIPDSD